MSLMEFFLNKGWVVICFKDRESFLIDLKFEEIIEFAKETIRDVKNPLSLKEKIVLQRLIDEEDNFLES